MTTPSWLEQREGTLRPGLNPFILLVLINGHPQYKLVVVPALGKYTCVITQTNSGKRLDQEKTYSGDQEALQGGLEELRQKLGW